MRKEEIVGTLLDSIRCVLDQKASAGKIAIVFRGTTLEDLVLEMANNAAAPLVLFQDLENETASYEIDRALDVCGVPRTSDGVIDHLKPEERIRMLGMQRNAAEERVRELQAELDNIKQEQRK